MQATTGRKASKFNLSSPLRLGVSATALLTLAAFAGNVQAQDAAAPAPKADDSTVVVITGFAARCKLH